MKRKQTGSFFLALILISGMIVSSTVSVYAEKKENAETDQSEILEIQNVSEEVTGDTDKHEVFGDHVISGTTDVCIDVDESGQCTLMCDDCSDEEAEGIESFSIENEMDKVPMKYANSDVEAADDEWSYQIDSDTGILYRETFSFEKRANLSEEPVEQICIYENKIYALLNQKDVYVISCLDLDTLTWKKIVEQNKSILRFSVTKDSLYYLADQTLYVYDYASAEQSVLFQMKGLSRFWLLEDTVLEYIAGDEQTINQLDLQTGDKTAYENPISVFDDTIVRPSENGSTTYGLGISSLRSKFPSGKYWNHAGNPGLSNSVNNQNGYTTTPCPVHGTVGTSKQTCNGFQPGSSQLSWQCMGYAEKLGYDSTGYNPRENANGWYTYNSSSALSNLKAGDIVRYKNNGHSIFVIGVNGDTVTYTDCNSDGHCIIRWDATISKSTLASTFSYVRSAPGGLSPEETTCSCSTSYAGNYTCTTSNSNLNMRSGHGTGYSIVTTIPSGATVYVSKASGSAGWAHVQYNGYSGFASMEYLTKQGETSSRVSKISIWMSDSAMGEGISSVRTGDWLYLCYKLYDANSGANFDSYNTSSYSVSMKLYDPSGAETYSGQYTNDNNYIGIRRPTPGTYRGKVVFAYNSGGSTTVENSITMVYEPRVEASPSAVNLSVTGTNSQSVTVSYSGATNSNSIYINKSSSGSCFTSTWGSWSNNTIPLTITGVSAGTGTITLKLYDSDTNELLATNTISVHVEAPSYSVVYNANGGTGGPASQTKEYGVALTLSSTIPTRFGYNFRGWSTSSTATSASYSPGSSFSTNADTTLYAVWSAASEISGNYAGFTRTAAINYGGTGVYYKFVPYTSTYYRIYGTAESDSKVYLYDAAGNQLAVDDDSGEGNQFQLDYNFTAGETYYIYVRFYNGSVTGSLGFKIAYAYRIRYDANGGSGAPGTTYKYYDFDTTLSTTEPVRDGYAFQGWSTSSSAASADYQPGATFTTNSNTTLYAVWSVNSYTVTYNANGGSGAPSSQTKTGGTALTLSTTVPTRFGYTFKGWSTSSTATSATYLPGGSFSTNANTTLYAVWQSAVTISPGVVNGSYIAPISFANGDKYYSFTPSFSGKVRFESSGDLDTLIFLYDAQGRLLDYDDDSGDSRNFMLTYSVESGTQYYAKIKCYETGTGTINFTVKRAYDITYNTNGGTGTISAQVKVYGTALTLTSETPTRTGYTFLGWSTSSTATEASYQPGGTYSANASAALYAVWSANSYTVTYNANGGSGAPSSQTKTDGTALTLSTTVPTRFGYTFKGWSTSSTATSATYLPGGSFTTNANTTLYAVWQSAIAITSGVTSSSYSAPISFANGNVYYSFTPSFSGKVRFESTGSLDTQIYLYNAQGTQLTYDDDSGDSRNFMLTYSVESGTQYYAKVKCYGTGTGTINFTVKRAYDITYNTNGGTGTISAQVKVYGTALTLTSAMPTRTGYTFLGWSTSSTATTASYQPGGTYSANAGAVLYAVWKTDNIQEGNCGSGLSYKLSQSGVLTISGTGAMNNYSYKSEVPWYSYQSQIKSVTIEEGVTSIGSYAFYGLTNLTSISIAEGVTSIGEYAFKNCTVLDNVMLPGTLTKIGESAFYGCTGLSRIDIPEGIYTIWAYTFKNCTSLESVSLPDGLIKIDEAAFYGCSALTELTIPDSVSIIGIYCFKNCTKLAKVQLPTSLTQIREAAFYGTALTNLNVPASVTKIGPYAFKNCTRLATINLPEKLTSIGEAAFYGSAVKELVISDEVTTIGSYAFKNCTSLKSVDLSEKMSKISESCFYNCSSLIRVTLPDSIKTIDSYAFRKCDSLLSVAFSKNLTNIGESAFYGCTSLILVNIPEGVTAIGAYAFKSCTSLDELVLPDSLATIGESTFYGCTGLSELTIPANVTSVGNYAFAHCTGMTKITFTGDAPTISSNTFSRVAATVYYPSGNATWTNTVKQNYGGTLTWVMK